MSFPFHLSHLIRIMVKSPTFGIINNGRIEDKGTQPFKKNLDDPFYIRKFRVCFLIINKSIFGQFNILLLKQGLVTEFGDLRV